MEVEGLSIVNPLPRKLAGPTLLHHIVKPASNDVAIEHWGRQEPCSYSYRDLHAASDCLALQIASYKRNKETKFVVPVLIGQSPELYIALLAILKAGGAFCPLSVEAPAERLKFILHDVSASVIVATEDLAAQIPTSLEVAVIIVDRVKKGHDPAPVELPETKSNDLAYVMYTSGSTGTPKGVGISHLAATQALLAHEREMPEFSRFLQFASPTFDVSVFEIFFPLLRGCTLITAPRREMLDDLPRVMREMQVDACELTPTVVSGLLKTRANVPTLKLLLTIGEMLTIPILEEFGGDEKRKSILWAMYGPTEATIHCTLQTELQSSSSVHNIGEPLDTVSCFVIDPGKSRDQNAELRILPRGEIGELAIGGWQLAEGYINRDDETRSSFISSPYGRIYRTGDKARVLHNGKLECLGRLSEGQVKLRGQRIELGEIERTGLKASGCHGAVAMIIDSNLILFCSVDSGVVEDGIMQQCRQWLPPFMFPGDIVLVEELPCLPSGKINKKQLEADFRNQNQSRILTHDTNKLLVRELEILQLLSRELDVEVSPNMTLTSIGVDSLRSIKLASSLRRAGFHVGATRLLGARKVHDLFATIQPYPLKELGQESSIPISLLKELERITATQPNMAELEYLVEDVLPCTPLQNAMLAQSISQRGAYWNEILLEVNPGVSGPEIMQAVQKLVHHTEILRSGFVEWQSKFVQLVFSKLRDEQIQRVVEFQYTKPTESDGLLRPLKMQLRDGKDGHGVNMLISIHHSIYDGWSMDLILKDLSDLLKGICPSPRPPFQIFMEYVNTIASEKLNEDRAFWSDHLLDWKKTVFPKLQPGFPHNGRVQYVLRHLDIPISLLRAASQSIGCSIQVYFQAATSLVWSKILGTSDILIGSVTSGRVVPIVGIEEMIGPCIASLPLRVDLGRSSVVKEVLLDIMSSNRKIAEHSLLPLADIRKLTEIQSGDSLYDVLFVYQESLYSREKAAKLIHEMSHCDRSETKFTLEVEPHKDTFKLQGTFHTEYFSQEFVEQLMEQVEFKVRYFIANPEGSVMSLEGVDNFGLSMHDSNPKSCSQDEDLARLFENAAARNPSKEAIRFSTTAQTTTLSFEALNNYSNQIGNLLLNNGAKSGDVIAIVMEKSPTLYASILGIVKAGCAYLPLLPSTPKERARDIFESGKIQYCLIDKSSSHVADWTDSVFFIQSDLDRLDTFSSANLDVDIDMSRLAYVIYTSGTTGVPKGVAVTQRNIVSNVVYLGSVYPDSKKNEPRFLQACSQAFDVSVFEIFYAWHKGMCLCAASNDDLFEDLEEAIRKMRITHLSLAPTVASLIDPRNVPTVEFLVTAGEPMTSYVYQKWEGLLWQGYGPSETTNICSVKHMQKGEHIEHLGWVFPNTSIIVLATDGLDALPIGWVGEFCFGGDQVAAGYLNMPELTAEKFINHPKFGRLYRSGDFGRMLPDKSLIILGRLDGQVKLRGQRVETGDISAVITRNTLVSEVVTMLVSRDDLASDQLASFYVRRRDKATFQSLEIEDGEHSEILSQLEVRLPSYMIPAYLIPISSIPITPSGKVDRRALQFCFTTLSQTYLERASSTLISESDSEWTDNERIIAEIVADKLGKSIINVRRWTPFVSLGLDSLSAIGVARDLRLRFEKRLAVSDVLRNATVAQLARFIENKREKVKARDHEELLPRSVIDEVHNNWEARITGRVKILPCTPLQQAMLSQGAHSYFNKVLFELRLPVENMKDYWNFMIHRHSILRTCFVTTNDVNSPIVQVVLDEWPVTWQSYTTDKNSMDDAVSNHLNSLPEAINTFIPPLSLAIIESKGINYLSFICHHALYDGVAVQNLWGEVENMAHGKRLDDVVPYERFLREMMTLPDDVEEFWTDHLRGFSPTNLFSRGSRGAVSQQVHSVYLNSSWAEIGDRIKDLGVSLLSTCQAAWANTLEIASEKDDVCFGCVMSGRTIAMEGIDRLVAPCFNTIPIRNDLSGIFQRIELIKDFHKLNSDLLRYQFTPLRLTQKILNNQGAKLFDTLLILQQPLQDIDDRVWILEEDSGEMDVPLVCEVTPCPGINAVVIRMHYDLSLVSRDLASAFSDLFKKIFEMMLQSPSATLADQNMIETSLMSTLGQLNITKETQDTWNEAKFNEDIWTEPEKDIRNVLSELSKIPFSSISKRTTIFQLGLDSINAVQIASILRRRGHDVSSSDVVEFPSCEKLAAKIQSGLKKLRVMSYDLESFSDKVSPSIKAKLLPQIEAEAILPCTPMQCAMLSSFHQSQGKNYLNLISYQFNKEVSVDVLEAAWEALTDQHPMLRTGFEQVFHADTSFAMIRYIAGSFPNRGLSLSERLGQAVDPPEWKKLKASDIQSNLLIPPWRVGLQVVKTGVVMHLLIHHALYDAQSLEMILMALSSQLQGQAENEMLTVDSAVRSLMSQALNSQEEARKFWESKAESVVVNSFPIMTPLQEQRRRILTHAVTSSLSFSQLQRETRTNGISIQAVLQAAWARVLSRYLGEDSVVFGVPLSGRTTDETQGVPFPCLITIPVIARNNFSNRELVESMMEYNKAVQKHQFSPLGQIQKWLGHPASAVFDTLLVYQKFDRVMPSSVPWRLVNDEATVEYSVSLEIEPVGDAINLSLTFFDDILPAEQARLLVDQFDATLRHLTIHRQGHEDHLYRESPKLFSITPPVCSEIFAPVQLLHEFVEIRAVSHPHDIALEFVSRFDGETPVKETWTYGQLDEIGNRVANMLQDEAPVGSIVAIHFDKCPEAYFSILGILKAGCSFVALDSSAPQSRKEFIIKDSAAPCLLTADASLNFKTSARIIEINRGLLRKFGPEKRELGDFSSSNTCYCLYTSGTTGTPKGCEITHENCVQAMMAFQDLFTGHWDQESRWLQFASLHFDVSVLEQYWSWATGITLVAAPKDVILDDLIASINRLAITHIDLTPSLARLTHPDDVPTLCKGVFITGGEQLRQEILDAWGPKAVIYNAYGPTEATIGVTTYQRVPVNGRPSNIGKQFLNVGSYVFRKGTEVPVLRGAVGELCVSGKLVGKGYLNRPELTEERFPVLQEFGEKIYRTGDLVRILHDGCFDFLGRADDQVKLRGQRLEIGEINHVIRIGVPDVKDVATLVIKHSFSGKDVLISFVVGKQDKKVQLGFLMDNKNITGKARAACREKLPGYMVPTYFMLLPYIPLSSNNKVEAKELKALFNEISHEQLMEFTKSKATSNQLDTKKSQRVVSALKDLCKVQREDIKLNTSIFDLGVDSITILQLSSLLKSHGFGHATPALLLRNPVVSDLCEVLSGGDDSVLADGKVREATQLLQAVRHKHKGLIIQRLKITVEDIEYIAPCSALQQGIISRAMVDDNDTYFNSFVFDVKPGVSGVRMRGAWEKLVADEPVLSTAFVKTSDGYVQVARRNRAPVWETHSVRNLEEADEFMRNMRQRWIHQNQEDISTPLQFLLLTMADGNRRLVVFIFHAIYDGNSFDLMLDRVLANYNRQEIMPGPSFLDALSHGPLWKHDDSRSFWNDHLHGWDGLPLLHFSGDTSDNAIKATQVISGKSLEHARARHNVTLQSVMMALWVSVLQKCASKGLTVGILVSGRSIDLPGVENVIGPLFNTVPFFNRSFRGQSWEVLIQKCHDFSMSILPFQHVALKDIQKWCSSGRQLFDNLFVFGVENELSSTRNTLWDMEDGLVNPDYPLALEATKLANGDVRLALVAQAGITTKLQLERILSELEDNAASLGNKASLGTQIFDDSDETPGTLLNKAQHETARGQEYPFEWADSAAIIRDEIVSIAQVSIDLVDPTKTVLELGLDSIDVIQLSARLRKRGLNLSSSRIMREQSIAAMVKNLKADEPSTGNELALRADLESLEQQLREYAEKRGIDLDLVERVLPPTPLQEAMVSAMMQSDFEWYFNHELLQLEPGVDLVRFQNAWAQVIRQSLILRTGFLEVDDCGLDMAYCQVVHNNTTASPQISQISSLGEVPKLISRVKKTAISGNGLHNLFELTYVQCAEKTFVLVSMAHALYDGWSLSLMYHNLKEAYRGNVTECPTADGLFQRLRSSDVAASNQFWSSYLHEALPSVFLPLAVLDSSQIVTHRHETSFTKSLDSISAFCRRMNITLQTLCQASWSLVLANRVKSLDVLFGVVLSGRDFDGAEDLVFPTINTVPLRCVLHGTSRQLLQYLEGSMMEIRDHQSHPLRNIQAAAQAPGSELFNSLFMLQKAPAKASDDVLFTSVDGVSALDYPVCVEAEALREELVWRVACQSSYFTVEETEELVKDILHVLGFLIESDDVGVLSFLDEGISICGLPSVLIGEARLPVFPVEDDDEKEDGENWTKTSLDVRKVLSYVSGIPQESIRLSNTLYQLGLDSISAIKVSGVLRKDGIHIKPRDLVKSTSLAQMAELASQPQSKGEHRAERTIWAAGENLHIDELLSEAKISEDDVEVILPALPFQVYMISAWQNSGGSTFFPEFRYFLEENVSLSKVYATWDSLVLQSPLLRAIFVATTSSEQPFAQVILKASASSTHLDGQRWVSFKAVEDSKTKRIIISLRIHHALYDGISLPSLLRTFIGLLTERNTGSELELEPWSRKTIQTTSDEARQSRKHFWVNYLDGIIPLDEETSATPGRTEPNMDRISYLKRGAITDVGKLRAAAAQHGISTQALFFAAYAKTLATRRAAQGEEVTTVVFGVYVANRGHDAALPLTYPTLNLVPLRIHLSPDDDLAAVARDVQRDVHEISAQERVDVGLWEIAAWTGVKVTSFVNFLSLGDEGLDGLESAGELPAGNGEAGDGLVGPSSALVERNVVRDDFPPAVDIEASIRDHGLDVGVFGARSCLSEQEAAQLIGEVCRYLELL